MHDPQRRQGPGSVGALAEAESRNQHGESITASISTTPNTDPREQFRAAIAAAGLAAPGTITADGALHRFASNGKRGDTAGWYVLHDDGIAAGAFGCWRSGTSETWCADPGRTLTAEEKAEQRRRIEAASAARAEAEKAMHAEAAERAQDEWKAAPAADDQHPYLLRKRVKAHGLRVDDEGRLLVPVRDSTGRLTSLQRIGPDGEKRFLPGGQVAGGYFSIGTPRDTVCIAEGYATAASIHEATGHAVAVAFNAGNLLPVARAMREKFSAVKLIVCADDDAGTPGNPGLTKAREAAQAVGALLALPDFGTDRPEGATDFNDMATHRGADAVRVCIERARGDMVIANAAQSAARTMTHEGEMPDAAQTLSEVRQFLSRFVSYPSTHALVAHALWIAHTHAIEAWESTPRIAFLSPEPGSGKTRALEATALLVPRPVAAVSATPAYLFRKVADKAGPPTLLYDEIDTVFGPRAKENEEIRSMLNAGHRRGATAGRCVIRGKIVETEELPAFCAVALAGLGALPDTILSRSIVVRMRRRAPGEKVEAFRHRVHAAEGHAIGAKLARVMAALSPTLARAWPVMPAGIEDRNADIWEALLAIADAAGGEWPGIARAAAVALVADSRDSTPSLGVRLLADLKTIFATREAVSTAELLDSLIAMEEAPWAELRGRPIDSRKLANLLRPYGAASKTIRFDGRGTPKGYLKSDLLDPWARYLPLPPAAESATSATSATRAAAPPRNVADVADVALPEGPREGQTGELEL